MSELAREEIVARMGERCPTCNRNWWLFPPVKVFGCASVRCVECKDDFPAAYSYAGRDAEKAALLNKPQREDSDV